MRFMKYAALAFAAALMAGCGTDSDTGNGPASQPTGSARGSIYLDLGASTGTTATGTATVLVGNTRLVLPVDVDLTGGSRVVRVDYTFDGVPVGRTGVLYVASVTVGGVAYTFSGYAVVSVSEGDTAVVDTSDFVDVHIDTTFTPVGSLQISNLHVPSTTVSDPIVTLSGTISNQDIGTIFVYVNGDVFPVALDLSGGSASFTVTLTLDPGVNEIVVAGMNTNGQMVLSSPIHVTYTSTIAGNTMLGTLIWDSPTSDIDLHLWYYTETSPTSSSTYSQHCYYSSKDLTGIRPDEATDGAGNLDVDDVDGYGPEHMTLINYPDGYYVFALNRFSMDQDLTSNCIFTLKLGSYQNTTSTTFTTSSNYWYRCFDVRVEGGVATILSPNTALAVGLGKTLLPAKVK
jgi:uncharacterized protein YfaP (DUF2135 family)